MLTRCDIEERRIALHAAGEICHDTRELLRSGIFRRVVSAYCDRLCKRANQNSWRRSACLAANRYIRELQIVADNMGSLDVGTDGQVPAHGTETGASIRLDDLQQGYVFHQVDCAMIVTPQKTNARLGIPGWENAGPREAAKALFSLVSDKKTS